MAADPSRPRRLLSALARLLRTVLLLGLLAATGWWAWQQPFMQLPRTWWELSRAEAPVALPVPVEGVRPDAIADTWGAGRSGGRQHEGVDIFAAAGTPVLSSTPGIVSSIRETGLGGRQVWVVGPALERHYYAHLHEWADGLQAGAVVEAGQMLGTVGNTGNARGTPPHLHYGIYGEQGALDPLPRLRASAP